MSWTKDFASKLKKAAIKLGYKEKEEKEENAGVEAELALVKETFKKGSAEKIKVKKTKPKRREVPVLTKDSTPEERKFFDRYLHATDIERERMLLEPIKE